MQVQTMFLLPQRCQLLAGISGQSAGKTFGCWEKKRHLTSSNLFQCIWAAEKYLFMSMVVKK